MFFQLRGILQAEKGLHRLEIAQRKVAEAIVAEWEACTPRLEPMCRMLLVADRYGVTLLRNRCLHALAARFEALVGERAPRHEREVSEELKRAPRREREVFEAFVAAVAPRVNPGSHLPVAWQCRGHSSHPYSIAELCEDAPHRHSVARTATEG